MVTRLIVLALVLVCGVGLFIVVDNVETAPLKAAQQLAQDRFGPDLINLCQGVTETHGKRPSNSKITAIDSDRSTVYDVYNEAIPTSLRATDKSDVDVLLCLKEDKVVFDKAEYGDPTKYVCTQYERDLIGYLVDVKTGKTLDYKRFRGLTPPDCPDSTDADLTETGKTPLPSDISEWLTGISANKA